MKVIIQDETGKELFSYADPEKYPGALNMMCAVNEKKAAIIALADSIQILCDTQFPIE